MWTAGLCLPLKNTDICFGKTLKYLQTGFIFLRCTFKICYVSFRTVLGLGIIQSYETPILWPSDLKRPWCWERLKARGEGDDRRWDGWMASPTQWTWVWVNSRSWWWTGRPGVLQSTGSQRVGHDWATELNWATNNACRHQFANKGPSSQRYGFASSHTQMWKLDHKEGWELNNWWFRTVMLAKMDIKPVNLKGYQPWTFIGKTDAEAPIHWAPDAKSQLIGKNPDARKVWGQEKKEATEDEMVGWHHQLNRHEFEQTQGDSEREGSLVCCSPWGHKEWHTTEQLNSN